MKNKKGFTLVEIIGVVVILGIVLGLVSIAYVSINNHIKTTYYKEIETVLLQTAGEYYTYNQGEAPEVFGNNAEVSIATLVNGQYIEEVTDRNGNACDGYVVAYKNSYDRTNYYVCLKCSDYETDNAACRGEVDYSLQMTATVKDTTTRYQEGSFVNDYVTLTFRTFNDVKEIKVENENGDIVKSCNLEIKNDIASCKIQIDETGEYTAYGVSENGTKTDEKEISIKIDNQKPSFDIYENGVLITDKQEKDATNGDIDLVINVLNIRDLESGIKNIRYSFEKEGETNYQTVTTPREEFTIEKTLEIGKYTLIVEIEDNAGNRETKTIEYEVYRRLSIPTTDMYCNDLTYNGTEQELTKPSAEGFTFLNNKGTNAGSYTVRARLNENYRWSDGSNTDKTFTCTINKATPTLTLSATSGTVNAGSTISFTESANVVGNFSNVSGTTSVATVSPASYTGVAANTTRTVTVTGVSNGSSKITVTFTPTDTTNYNTRTATYTVTGYRIASVGSCNNLIYNGVSQTLASGGTGVSYSNNTRTAAGSQTVTVTASSGYRFSDNTTSKTLNCSINKKSVAVTWGNTTTFTYNGKTQAPTATASSGVSGETLSITRTTGINAGSYTSTASLSSVTGGQASTSNYTLTGTTKAFTINKATPTLTLSATSGTVNAGSKVTFTEKASVAGNFSNVSGTTSVATVSPGSYTGVAANTAKTVTITGVSNGSSKITVTFTPTDTTNYNTRTATYTVTGYKVASTGSCQSRTYNGTSQTLASGGTGVSYSNNTRTAAGSQTVTVTASSGYRFSDNTTSKTLNCSINKKLVAVTWGSTTTFTYNGKAQAPTATASSGVSGETLNITRTTGTNAGSYTSTASLSSVTGGQALASNYTLTGTTKSFTINKATPTLTLSATSGSVNAGSTVTFTERASVAGSFSNVSGTTSVATVSPASYTGVAANTARTVTVTGVSYGSSRITVTFTPTDTTNYNTRTAIYTVTGYYNPATTGSCNNLTYNGRSQTLASGGTGVSYSNNTRTNAGSQTVTVTALSGYRFSDNTTSKTLNCSINKKSVAVTWGSTTTFTYNGKAQAPTATASSGVSGETLNITRTTRTNPGSYTSTASLSSVTGGQALTSNYTLTGTTKAFKINNATLSGGSVVITGSNKVGSTLTAKVTNTSPTATYKYQWWYSSSSSATSGTNISGATSSTYVPTATYRGYYIGVTVTASKTYYNSKTFNDKTDATNNSYATLVQEVTYTVRHYQMNNDGVNYTLVSTTTGTDLVGESVTPPVNTYQNFTSPSTKTITLSATASNNVVNYYYTRTCYGEYCGYCTKGSALGQCMYEERSELGLYQSGLTNDEDNYRVIGTKTDQPNNYICFGTTDEAKCTDATYLHRIIGVFTDSHQVRLIREEANAGRRFHNSSLSTAHYHYSSLATGSFSSIPTTATFGWPTTINGSTKWSDIVINRTFGEIHNMSAYTYNAQAFVNIDEAVEGYSGSYTSKAYPIALSDLLLSTGSTTLTFQNSYNTIKNSWLLLGSNEWTYQMFNTSHAWVISSGGKLCGNSTSLSSYCSEVSGYVTYSYAVRTNFQLHQNVLFCGGDGSKTDPIILGWGNCTN